MCAKYASLSKRGPWTGSNRLAADSMKVVVLVEGFVRLDAEQDPSGDLEVPFG